MKYLHLFGFFFTLFLFSAPAADAQALYSARKERQRSTKKEKRVPSRADSLAFERVRSIVSDLGRYEVETVVEVPGATATELYDRVRVALADWAGPGFKSQNNLDYTERDAGIITSKGRSFFYQHKANEIFANYILKVHCRDGRARVVYSVPSVVQYYRKDGDGYTRSLRSFLSLPYRQRTELPRQYRIVFATLEMADLADASVQFMRCTLLDSNEF